MKPDSDDRIESTKDRYEVLGQFIKQLYTLGGMALVLVGLGAAVLLLPYVAADARELISIALFVLGAAAWTATTYLAVYRWKTEMQIVARQDELLLQAVCQIAVNEERSGSASARIGDLTEALQASGVRWLKKADAASQSP